MVFNGPSRFIYELWVLIISSYCKRGMVLQRLHLVFAVLSERKKVHKLGPWVVFHGVLKQRLFILKQGLPCLLVCQGSFGSEGLL
jgi:hypothetical protein